MAAAQLRLGHGDATAKLRVALHGVLDNGLDGEEDGYYSSEDEDEIDQETCIGQRQPRRNGLPSRYAASVIPYSCGSRRRLQSAPAICGSRLWRRSCPPRWVGLLWSGALWLAGRSVGLAIFCL